MLLGKTWCSKIPYSQLLHNSTLGPLGSTETAPGIASRRKDTSATPGKPRCAKLMGKCLPSCLGRWYEHIMCMCK